MIINIRFKIIVGKINKMPEFYMIFARKMPDYIIRQLFYRFVSYQGQAKAKSLRPRPKLRGQGQNFDLKATLASRT